MRKQHTHTLLAMSAMAVAAFFCGCGGNSNETPASSGGEQKTEAAPSGTAAQAVPASGEDVYKKTCQTCHQANGEGMPATFPPLAKSDFLSDKSKTIRQVLNGSSGEITVNGQKFNGTMPPQGSTLSDNDIAAVLTYVYSSWGNTAATVTAEEVKAEREKTK